MYLNIGADADAASERLPSRQQCQDQWHLSSPIAMVTIIVKLMGG